MEEKFPDIIEKAWMMKIVIHIIIETPEIGIKLRDKVRTVNTFYNKFSQKNIPSLI